MAETKVNPYASVVIDRQSVELRFLASKTSRVYLQREVTWSPITGGVIVDSKFIKEEADPPPQEKGE